MENVKIFYLEDCPYCRNARLALKELSMQDPRYAENHFTWIEESRQPQLADQYDYYYVPSVFYGTEKLYEAHPGESYEECKKNLKGALDAAAEKMAAGQEVV